MASVRTKPPLVRPDDEARIDHGQRRKTVVKQLLAAIFQGELKAGERLIIQDLAKRLGVSPTPIREALVELEGIGIIDFIPNCGGLVREVTGNDVKEVCQVRKALECEATRSACGRIQQTRLEELREAFRRVRSAKRHGAAFVERARQLDSHLHDLIAQSCGNRFLARELERMKLLFRAFRDASWEKRLARNDCLRVAEEADEHLAIVEPLIAGDGERAALAMATHILSGEEYWSRGLRSD